MALPSFVKLFSRATGKAPFPWQEALFDELVRKKFRKACDVPTGLGKTSVITIWLLALAHHAYTGTLDGFPRRLVYVVNRRTVVDQATDEAKRLRDVITDKDALRPVTEALQSLVVQPSHAPLAISTLRGQFADNAEWRNDPARPAVIVGTVDMIGSRLLFAGYGCGFKSRPLHAGFLGQDVLLVHDEAHLEPAFQQLLAAIEAEQQRCRDFGRFRVMALTATPRSGNSDEAPIFSDKDRDDPEVRKRFNAKKSVGFHPVEDEKGVAEKIIELALEHKDSDKAVLIFARFLKEVEEVAKRLGKEVGADSVQTLTGTMRGLERDSLAKDDPIFSRFMPKSAAKKKDGTVFLICTSAGEVGVDISADHLVCDLTPFDSMAQRLGRVNRFGDGDATIDVVYEWPDDASDRFDQSRRGTLWALHELRERTDGFYDASPAALNAVPQEDRQRAFTPEPTILPATDILFDAWALTSVRERFPGRPPVADWLHGVAEWEPPETHVAWRKEVGILTKELRAQYEPDDLLGDYPLKPHELLRDVSKRVFDHLMKLAEKHPESPVWIVSDDQRVEVTTLNELVNRREKERAVENRTVLLPPEAGGLDASGMLDGKQEYKEQDKARYDVADGWRDSNNNQRRCRVWDKDRPTDAKMRLVRKIDTRPGADEDQEEGQTSERRYWRWYVRPRSADDEGSQYARGPQELQPHLETAADFAGKIGEKLGLREPEASAIKLAARWHDLGKRRKIWQLSIGNSRYPDTVLAKSGGKMWARDLNNYRHEFGSLLDLLKGSGPEDKEFANLAPETRDLVLHLIAAHHGRARPHFPPDEASDPEKFTEMDEAEVAREVPRRFARLQKRYGRWGLAYLESLVRAADIMASQANDVREEEPSNVGDRPQGESQ